MSRKTRRALVLATLVALGGPRLGAALADAPTPAAAAFLTRLQRALEAGDRRAVSTLVSYPATVLMRGLTIPVVDAKTLLQMYDGVFTPELRCAILETGFATTDAPKPARPAVLADNALSLAGGLASARFVDGGFRLARITVPPGKIMPPPRIERVAFPADRRELRQLQFAGRLARDQVETFLATLRAGETLEATITGFSGHDATVRVVAADQPIGESRSDAGRQATFRAPAAGAVRVEVIRLAPFCAPDLLYRITMTLR